MTSYCIYGLRVVTDHPFRTPLATAEPSDRPSPHDVRFSCRLVDSVVDLPRDSLVYADRRSNRFGESVVQLFATPDGALMRFARIADFHVRTGSIRCSLLDERMRFLVDICFLGHVLTYYVERLGRPAIHAGAVAVDGSAVLFSADSSGGKSSIVASFVDSGFPLVADDISVLSADDESVTCHRGYPQIKLTPQQIDDLLPRFAGHTFERVHPDFPKVGVPAARIGAFARRSLPLGAIYLLARSRSADAPVLLEPVSPQEALIHLIRNSFLAELVDATDLRASRLAPLSRIAARVPVRRLRYPTSYDAFARVHEIIRRDLMGVSE